MSDAKVIPINGRGRPRPGTDASPSAAAARSVAHDDAGTAHEEGAKRRRVAGRPRQAAEKPAAAKPARRPTAPKRVTRKSVAGSADPGGSPSGTGTARPATVRTAFGPRLVVDEPPDEVKVPPVELLAAVATTARDIVGALASDERVADFLAFVRRRIAGTYQVDEFGFDQELTERVVLSALRPLAEKWFRVEVRGAENIPAAGGALVVANHSGTVPIDGLVTSLVVHDHAHRFLRLLAADLVFTVPFVGELARKGGATMACNEDAERLLAGGELVGVYPEGFKGVGKPYSERYKLQRFGRGGFVSAAIRSAVPIIPCSIVGAEEIYPLVGNLPVLARLLGLPYVPITPFFPWLGPLGVIPLPSRWIIEFGEPVRTDVYAAGAADDPMLVFNVTDQVREAIQQTLYRLLISRRSVFL